MASVSELQFDMRKFGRMVGVSACLKDVDNTIFTEYVTRYRDDLVKYAQTLKNIDKAKAEDLVDDTWISYKRNEEDGKCFSTDKGHDAYITPEEAVKARMKRMVKRMDSHKKESKYLQNTSASQVICAHFTDDTDDDSLQTLLTRSARETSNEIESINVDLKDSMMYFIACTQDCRIPGLVLLEKIDTIIDMVEHNTFSSGNANYISDLWTKGKDIKSAFTEIVTTYSKDIKTYFSTLTLVKEELKECKQMLDKHHMEATRRIMMD